MENLNNTNSSSGRGNNNLLKENILINVFLGIVCIFIIIGLIIIIKIRFCKKKSYDVNNNNKDNILINNSDSVQRIPNPLYRIDSISNNKLYTTIDEEIISVRI